MTIEAVAQMEESAGPVPPMTDTAEVQVQALPASTRARAKRNS
jgi:hypothetical protein